MLSDLMWALYFIDVIDKLIGCLFAGVFIAVILVCMKAAIDNKQPTMRVIQSCTAIGLFVGLMLSAIPSKDTMYLMLGVKTTDNVMQTDTGQRLQLLLNKKLDKYIEEIEVPNLPKKE